MKVYCVYNDGNHIDCFPTRKEAEEYAFAAENNLRMADVEEEDFDPKCDCGNMRIIPDNEF
jgi:hypothetical protein